MLGGLEGKDTKIGCKAKARLEEKNMLRMKRDDEAISRVVLKISR